MNIDLDEEKMTVEGWYPDYDETPVIKVTLFDEGSAFTNGELTLNFKQVVELKFQLDQMIAQHPEFSDDD